MQTAHKNNSSNVLDPRKIAASGHTVYGLALTLLLLAYSAAGLADPVPRAVPDSQSFSSERLARIDTRMRRAVDDGVMAGAQAVIARGGAVVYEQTWGHADREREIPMADDALFRIYSMTKPVTAVALLMLYEEGHFLLEDPVARYLPELADLKLYSATDDGEQILVAPTRQPTIRDLLRHTAGLSYGIFSNTTVDEQYRALELLQSPDLDTFTARLGELPLLLNPGTRWHYSVAVDVQGALVERISGQPFGDFLYQRLFRPLGMADTFFVVPDEKRARLTQLYSPRGTTLDWNTPWQFTAVQELVPADPELTRPFLDGHLFQSGGAGLVSSAEDYLRFALMLLNEGELDGVRILSPRTVRLMSRDHSAGIDTSSLFRLGGFGLGVGIVDSQHAELDGVGSYSWGGAAGTLFWVDPQNDLVGIFMVQSVPHQTQLSQLFRVLTYQAILD